MQTEPNSKITNEKKDKALIMFWNEFGIHKTSKFGLFVNEIKPIKF